MRAAVACSIMLACKAPASTSASAVVESTGVEPRITVVPKITASSRALEFRYQIFMRPNDPRPTTMAIHASWQCDAGGPCRYAVTRMVNQGHEDPEVAKIVKQAKGEVRVGTHNTVEIVPATVVVTTPNIVELLRMTTIVYPTTPIGKGARWKVSEADLERTFTVHSIDASQIEVAVDFAYQPQQGASMTATAKLRATYTDPLALEADMKSYLKQPPHFDTTFDIQLPATP